MAQLKGQAALASNPQKTPGATDPRREASVIVRKLPRDKSPRHEERRCITCIIPHFALHNLPGLTYSANAEPL